MAFGGSVGKKVSVGSGVGTRVVVVAAGVRVVGEVKFVRLGASVDGAAVVDGFGVPVGGAFVVAFVAGGAGTVDGGANVDNGVQQRG